LKHERRQLKGIKSAASTQAAELAFGGNLKEAAIDYRSANSEEAQRRGKRGGNSIKSPGKNPAACLIFVLPRSTSKEV